MLSMPSRRRHLVVAQAPDRFTVVCYRCQRHKSLFGQRPKWDRITPFTLSDALGTSKENFIRWCWRRIRQWELFGTDPIRRQRWMCWSWTERSMIWSMGVGGGLGRTMWSLSTCSMRSLTTSRIRSTKWKRQLMPCGSVSVRRHSKRPKDPADMAVEDLVIKTIKAIISISTYIITRLPSLTDTELLQPIQLVIHLLALAWLVGNFTTSTKDLVEATTTSTA